MHRMLSAKSAILLCLHSVRVSLFVFRHVVITLLAFCTFQCDSCTHNFHLALRFLIDVLHGSLRGYPKLGIKKRPSSIR